MGQCFVNSASQILAASLLLLILSLTYNTHSTTAQRMIHSDPAGIRSLDLSKIHIDTYNLPLASGDRPVVHKVLNDSSRVEFGWVPLQRHVGPKVYFPVQVLGCCWLQFCKRDKAADILKYMLWNIYIGNIPFPEKLAISETILACVILN